VARLEDLHRDKANGGAFQWRKKTGTGTWTRSISENHKDADTGEHRSIKGKHWGDRIGRKNCKEGGEGGVEGKSAILKIYTVDY